MAFIQIRVKTPEALSDLLKAELSELGFDAFLDTEEGFEAAVEKEAFDEEAVDEIFGFYASQGSLSYHMEEVARQNWNQLWESHYEMVEISEECLIRADFHRPVKPYRYELVINPKMSFGTGHHATTKLMLLHQLETDFAGKTVLDAGTGTGVLGIMALKRGAASVDACDVEEWPEENVPENAAKNGVSFPFYRGTVQALPPNSTYDIILANINRNVLLEEMPLYNQLLKPQGMLFLSGFYVKDIPALVAKALPLGLQLFSTRNEQDWASLGFQKG